MEFGHGVQAADWFVQENRSPMYSRAYLIERGEVLYESARERQRLERDTLYIFPAHRPYRISHDPARPIGCLWFHMSPPDSLFTELAVIPMAGHPRIARLMEAIGEEIDDSSPARACLEPLVEALVALCHKGKLLRASDSRLRSMLEYMQANQRAIASIDQISDHFGYSKGYFVRLFSQLSGFTPHQYLICCRMNEAVRLLRSDMPLEEIAVQTGYTGAKSFSGAFKAHYGMPPNLFRKHFSAPRA